MIYSRINELNDLYIRQYSILYNSNIQILEDNRLADQTMDTNQEGRIIALENNMDANERILLNHASAFEEIKSKIKIRENKDSKRQT